MSTTPDKKDKPEADDEAVQPQPAGTTDEAGKADDEAVQPQPAGTTDEAGNWRPG